MRLLELWQRVRLVLKQSVKAQGPRVDRYLQKIGSVIPTAAVKQDAEVHEPVVYLMMRFHKYDEGYECISRCCYLFLFELWMANTLRSSWKPWNLQDMLNWKMISGKVC